MNIQEVISQLTEKFGNSFDISKVTELLKTLDLKNLSLTDIIAKLQTSGLLDNVNLDSVKGGMLDGLKSKAGNILGGILGK